MKKVGVDLFVEKANKIHNNKYNYENVIYINNYTPVEIICPIHSKFLQTPKNHYKSGCALCSYASMSKKDFITEANTIHNNEFDYSKSIYVNQNTKLIIICQKHGDFLQTPKIHLNGSGCPQCYYEKPKTNQLSLEEFIAQANKIHDNKYGYEKIIALNNTREKIIIKCYEHGDFFQQAKSHLAGHGCPKCFGNSKLSLEEFINRSNEIHDYKYDYSLTNYKNCTSKVLIICLVHGEFWQVAQDHLNGHGCAKCYKNISKAETEWLDWLKIPNDQEHRNVYIINDDKKYKVDGLLDNTVYEFYGDFWHGNPKYFKQDDINSVNNQTFGFLYSQTLERENEIKSLGYSIISIWENEWNTMKGKI